jgi:hypothetical protein
MVLFPDGHHHSLPHPPGPRGRSFASRATRVWPPISLIAVPFCLALALVLALNLAGCSDDATTPSSSGASVGSSLLAGSIDPSGTFLLEAVSDTVPVGQEPVQIQLLGRNLAVDPDSAMVSLEVAIQNLGGLPLHAPAQVWVGDFVPPSVWVANADIMPLASPLSGSLEGPPVRPEDQADPPPYWYGFDYSELLGEDGILEPREISGYKTWVFRMDELQPFSFAVRAEFGLTPDRPQLGGLVFEDLNRNGRHDPEEPPLPGRIVSIDPPEGDPLTVHVGVDGRYAMPVELPGLYRLQLFLLDMGPTTSPIPVEFTTPNPLEVLLVPGPDGVPLSYLDANFGVFFGPPPDSLPRVILTPQPPQELQSAPYLLARGRLDGNILRLRVGYSGCQPDHPFRLFMAGGFMESAPVQANLVLVHDDLGEECDAAFERSLSFQLGPIRRAYTVTYGDSGPIRLNLWQSGSIVATFLLGPISAGS